MSEMAGTAGTPELASTKIAARCVETARVGFAPADCRTACEMREAPPAPGPRRRMRFQYADPAAGSNEGQSRELFTDLEQRVEVVGRVAESGAAIEGGVITLRDPLHPERGEEPPRRVGGVAVRVLAASHGDDDGVFHPTVAVEHAHDDIGGVDFGIDIEICIDSLGTSYIRRPFFLTFKPVLLPVVRILLPPRDHIIDALSSCKGIIGGKKGAAHLLGIPRSTLQYRIKKLGINPAEI